MAAPLLSRVRVIAARVEGTPGTAETPLIGADAAFNVFEPKIQQAAEEVPREQQGGFSMLPSDVGAKLGTVTFRMELTAASSQPLWATTFLASCGMGLTAGVYRLDARPPGVAGTTQQTLTIAVYENGLWKQIYGAMGNVIFTFDAAKRCFMEFTYRGIWSTPADVGILSPTYPSEMPLQFISSALLIGAWAPPIAQLTCNLNNEVYVREDSITASGFSHAVIGTRRVGGTMNPEASLVATEPIYTNWETSVERSIVWACRRGTASAYFGASELQILNPQEADRSGVQIDEIEYQLNRDDLQMVLSDGTTTTTAGATTTA